MGDEGALVGGSGIIKVRGADKGVAGEHDRRTEVIGVSARDIGEFCVLGPSGARAFEDVDGALIIKGSDDLRKSSPGAPMRSVSPRRETEAPNLSLASPSDARILAC